MRICDEQVQKGISKDDFVFTPLPLFQVTPSAPVPGLHICFNLSFDTVLPKALSSFRVCAEPIVSSKLDFAGNQLLLCMRSCDYGNEMDACSAGMALSSLLYTHKFSETHFPNLTLTPA